MTLPGNSATACPSCSAASRVRTTLFGSLPTSFSPQASAAAAPLQLLHSLLGLAPQLSAGRASCAPAIPERYLPLRVSGLRLGKSRLTIDVHDGGWEQPGRHRDRTHPGATASARRP